MALSVSSDSCADTAITAFRFPADRAQRQPADEHDPDAEDPPVPQKLLSRRGVRCTRPGLGPEQRDVIGQRGRFQRPGNLYEVGPGKGRKITGRYRAEDDVPLPWLGHGTGDVLASGLVVQHTP